LDTVDEATDLRDGGARFRQHRRHKLPAVWHARPDLQSAWQPAARIFSAMRTASSRRISSTPVRIPGRNALFRHQCFDIGGKIAQAVAVAALRRNQGEEAFRAIQREDEIAVIEHGGLEAEIEAVDHLSPQDHGQCDQAFKARTLGAEFDNTVTVRCIAARALDTREPGEEFAPSQHSERPTEETCLVGGRSAVGHLAVPAPIVPFVHR